MKKNIADRVWFTLSVISFALLSASFLLMSADSGDAEKGLSTMALMAGILFWVSLVFAIVTQVVLSHRRKAWFLSNKIRKKRFSHKMGAISFFKNLYAVIADVATVICIIGLVVSVILTDATGYACYVFVSLLVFSFSMHCILNGNIYYYIFNQDVIIKTIEKERSNSFKRGKGGEK